MSAPRLGRALAAAVLVAFAAARFAVGRGPDPEPRLLEARARIEAAFADWRKRAERAAERLAELGRGRGAGAERFAAADAIVREERVDGVALVDGAGRARIWAGRTFAAERSVDYPEIEGGFASVTVLERPAHHVLLAAHPAGEEAALAFLAFDERFPGAEGFAERVAAETGVERVRLTFSHAPVPAQLDASLGETSFVVKDLCHVVLRPWSEERRAAHAAAVRSRLDRSALAGLALAASLLAWRRFGQALPRGTLARAGLAVGLLAALRLAFAALFDPEPAASHFLTALVALLTAAVLARAAPHLRERRAAAVLALFATAACAAAPAAYRWLLDAAASGVELFDPLRVLPAPYPAIALAAIALATGALFLLARAASSLLASFARPLGAAPFAAIALGALPVHGPVLAAGAAAAAIALARGGSRVERATAIAFLAAAASLPALSSAENRAETAALAERTRALVGEARREEARRLLEAAVARARDPVDGVDGEVAMTIARARGRSGGSERPLAVRLWEAARWPEDEACAVQVFDAEGRRLSAFDFDSPPEEWLPGDPPAPEAGFRELSGRGEGASIRFYAFDFPLLTPVDELRAGAARFVVPDRWDVLLAHVRPAIFGDPMERLVRAGEPPQFLAELDATGRVRRASDRADEWTPHARGLLERARERGRATARIEREDGDARLVVVAAGDGFAALVFADAPFRLEAFRFAKVLLVNSAACLLYALGLLATGRARLRLLFRHRVALAVVALSVPPVVLLAAFNRGLASERHEAEVTERLRRRLDLAEALLERRTSGPVDTPWCTAFAADHRADLNAYEGAELIATSRPGVWDTGLTARRLAAPAFVALVLEGREEYRGVERFGRDGALRVAYRRILGGWGGSPVILAAPALEDRRTLERRAAAADALLLAAYLLTATVTVFGALFLGRSLTAPLSRLQAATRRVASGDLAAELPEGRRDEFGDLVRDFNRMTRELREAQDLRVRAEREAAWREMAKQVAHEIKNPLTPLKLTIQNLLAAHAEDPDRFREEFESGAKLILEQIEALRRIAGEFSAYARFPNPKIEPLDLGALVEEVAALFAGGEGCRVTTDLFAGPLPVRADRDEMRRVLVNLLTNSRQAGARHVVLRACPDGDRIRLEVADDGSGIRPEHRVRLFEPAFTTKTSGTGLGLAICKRVVEGVGGTIDVDSEPGRGTRVVVLLPR
jgi:signal transduction histidine kinase